MSISGLQAFDQDYLFLFFDVDAFFFGAVFWVDAGFVCAALCIGAFAVFIAM